MLHSSRFSYNFSLEALLPVLLGIVLCLWSLIDKGTSLCVTTGCTLFQQFSVAGVSLWWFGLAAFLWLLFLLLLGKAQWGMRVAEVCLFLDMLLLLLMLLTAPCMACLGVAVFFALAYLGFRRTFAGGQRLKYSWILWVWIPLFIANAGAVMRAASDSWPIQGDEEAKLNIYFSPSCPVCREGVFALSGRIDVAFYPVAEDLDDLWVISIMQRRLEAGDTIAEALRAGRRAQLPQTILEMCRWDMYLLGLRLLRNHAHVLAAGSSVLPFVEYRGLPLSLKQKKIPAQTSAAPAAFPEKTNTAASASTLPPAPATTPGNDYKLPFDTGVAAGCNEGNGQEKFCR